MLPFATISPEHVTIIALAAIVAVAAVALVARLRTNLASAKREWLELSSLLTQHGMPHSAKIFECLAVEDLPGAFTECKYLLRALRDPKQAAAVLDSVFASELPLALSDAARRSAVVKTIGDWIAANPAMATAAGLLLATPK